MPGTIKHFFAGGHTARGFHGFYDSILQGLDRVFILKGGPGNGKSTLMKRIGEEWAERGYEIEYVHSASEVGSLDGVIVRQLKVGIVDGSEPHVVEPKAVGALETYVNLGEALDTAALVPHREEILSLREQVMAAYQKAYHSFAAALAVHDEWEAVYIQQMDYQKADSVAEELLKRLFSGERLNKKPTVQHMYLGAATSRGPVDYIPNLTEQITKRYLIKGRPGTGKSTMLKKLAREAEERGHDVLVFHCGFDPHSLDMIILPELQVALFDSTAPHEYFPQREGDEIIDMYERAVAPGTDEAFASELAEIKRRYTAKMNEATSCLAEAKAFHDTLERIYVPTVDFSIVDQYKKQIEAEMERLSQVAASG
ncbi:PRK06851 family protein [Brevibacillus humidisoli]|uniref:PRK06851 family protein n=1 Tax=Brevibacillus humidisoli TaxID=2895522 RepID=UPI001E5DFAEF|nr:PRK06851 family protein [Brevibacillus humidisoli]UFJ42384.1 PRK06851 family protein [Brevibacillus humidisoli]